MDAFQRQLLRSNRVYIVKNLSRLDEILDLLESEQIISEEQRSTILANKTYAQQVRAFLDILVRCGPLAFSKFQYALTETNQQDIADKLKHEMTSDSTLIRPRSTELLQKSIQPTPDRLMVHDMSRAKSATELHLIESYKVSSKPRGYILIINIEKYSDTSGTESRKGSTEDVNKLCTLFKELEYSVAVLENLTSDQFEQAITNFVTKEELSNVDAAGLIILSHGKQHHVIASDGGSVNIDWIISNFTNKNCPRLAQKPKLIIIQACRGASHDQGVLVPTRGPKVVDHTVVDHSLDPESMISLPHLSDCVIVYTTLPGFVSWRSETEGSWYISHFFDVFHTHGRSFHVLDLLTLVNKNLVSDCATHQIYQISQPSTTLTKSFYLSPGD